MSTVPLTARERLALAYWINGQKDAPTAESASAWVKEHLGKDATEASIETVLYREGLRHSPSNNIWREPSLRGVHNGRPAWVSRCCRILIL